jgi:hypothetical protein
MNANEIAMSHIIADLTTDLGALRRAERTVRDWLADAVHAVTHDRPEVAVELIERSIEALEKARHNPVTTVDRRIVGRDPR